MLPRIYSALSAVHLQSGAFSQLTTTYMTQKFNPAVPDDPDTQYFSYGAKFTPGNYSVWRVPHAVISQFEGENDGLVSVKSARWGIYEGTLVGVNHLGIINWVNRFEWALGKVTGKKAKFDALAFYCGVCGMFITKGSFGEEGKADGWGRSTCREGFLERRKY